MNDTFMQADACGNCKFYMATIKVCRRYPPTVMHMGISQGIGGPQHEIGVHFPKMAPNGWCGEHKSNEIDGEVN